MWTKSIEQEADDLLAWVHKRKYMAQSKYFAAKARMHAETDRERREEAYQQRIKNYLNTHHDSCPMCGGTIFLSELIIGKHMDLDSVQWYYDNAWPKQYCGDLDLEKYITYAPCRGYGWKYLKLFTCQCGHEWVELPKDYDEAEKG